MQRYVSAVVLVVIVALLASGIAAAAVFKFGGFPDGRWKEGSSHGPWTVVYDSNPCGRVGIVGNLYESDLSQCNTLHATKTRTNESYGANVTVKWEFIVVKKPRSNPRSWETAWLGWAHTGDNRWNNLILKSNGWELGKFHPDCRPGGSNRNQCYMDTGTNPRFADGRWHTGKIVQTRLSNGDLRIAAYGDGHHLTTVRQKSRLNTGGNVLLYSEGRDGAVVRFREVSVN